MAEHKPPRNRSNSLVERRARKIADARSVTLGLAMTFLLLAVVGAVFMRFADSNNFPTFGDAVWWALQTITTVGYGDAVPTTSAGKFVAGIEMVMGVSFIAFLTATVTSTVIQRSEEDANEAERTARDDSTKAIIDALAKTSQAVADLDARLDRIESKLPG